MTKIFNFALKIKGVVGRVAEAKSSDPAPKKNLERAHGPPLKDFDPGKAVEQWNKKKRRPNQKPRKEYRQRGEKRKRTKWLEELEAAEEPEDNKDDEDYESDIDHVMDDPDDGGFNDNNNEDSI